MVGLVCQGIERALRQADTVSPHKVGELAKTVCMLVRPSQHYFLPFFFFPDACRSVLVRRITLRPTLLGVLAPLPGADCVFVFGVANSSTAGCVGVPFPLVDAGELFSLDAACSGGTTAAALGADVPGAPAGACVGFIVICCGAGSPSSLRLLIIRFSAMSLLQLGSTGDAPSRSFTRGMFKIVSRVFSACAISVAVWKIIPPHPCLKVFASDTTSTISASSSFSAAAKRAIVSSPTSPLPCRFVRAILSSRMRQMRLTSAVARTSSADLRIESGTSWSDDKRDMYVSRAGWVGNQASHDVFSAVVSDRLQWRV